MAVHKWRERETRYFGRVWIPFAEIGVKATTGTFLPFVMQVDSGAVISLLRRSAAEILGLAFEAGRRVELTSVGHAKTIAYVHELVIRFDDDICLPVPFAISSSESAPNLLGRLGVFDHLQIAFSGRRCETSITAP